MILITGSPRSGTTYTAYILRNLGLEIGHELAWKDGIVAWQWAPALSMIDKSSTKILHQVRHPLKTIASSMMLGRGSHEYMIRHTSAKRHTSKILMDTLWWIEWNEMIEDHAIWRYRIEDISIGSKEYASLCKHCGVKPTGEALRCVSRKTNAKKHPELKFKSIRAESKEVARRLQHLAYKYGYEL